MFLYMYICMFTCNYMCKLPLLLIPEGQPSHKGQPFKGEQILDVEHQAVINVVRI